MKYVIGIDGGGTKTHALLLDEQGQIRATASGSTANYHATGYEQTVSTLYELIHRLTGQASLQDSEISQIVCCLAGIDSDQDALLMEQELIKHLACPIHVYNDGLAALYSVDGRGEGAILVAGTGSVAMGRDSTGELFRAGGWGHLVGDLGSGFDIGKRAIIAVLAASEGTGPVTVLSEHIPQVVQVEDANQLIAWASAYDRLPRELAALVPTVVQAAEAGDQVSREILTQIALELGKLGNHILDKGNWKQKQLTLVGGLEHIWKWIGPTLMESIAEKHADVQWVKPLYSPVVGASLLAFDQLGIQLAGKVPHLQGYRIEINGEDE